MATWDDVVAMAGSETGLCVVSMVRADGSPHASVVNAGPFVHPVTGENVVALVARGSSVKVKRVRLHGTAPQAPEQMRGIHPQVRFTSAAGCGAPPPVRGCHEA